MHKNTKTKKICKNKGKKYKYIAYLVITTNKGYKSKINRMSCVASPSIHPSISSSSSHKMGQEKEGNRTQKENMYGRENCKRK